MGWFRGRSAAALAAGALSALGNAQAFYGGDQSASCSASQNFYYLGCYPSDLASSLTPFSPEAYIPLALGNSYPGFSPDSTVNNTVTPQACVTVCRGYGYRTAALYAGSCSCGYDVPAELQPTTSGTCDIPCGGDSSQTCGGSASTQIYVDPSFADPVVLAGATPADIAAHYQYLGCFFKANDFPTDDDAVTITTQDSMALCLAQCAETGYPLARAEPINGASGQVTCMCGETFAYGDYRVQEGAAGGSCGVNCATGTSDTCDPGDSTCCGSGSYYPVYINPELEGCYVPLIPGYGQLDANGVVTAYVCADIPASLTSGPSSYTPDPSLYISASASQLTSSAQPTHPVSVVASSGTKYYELGCYTGEDVAAWTSAAGTDLEACASACIGSPYFAVLGDNGCSCGGDIGGASPGPFSQCNTVCNGDSTELCGGSGYAVVYAIVNDWVNLVATSIEAVLATPYPSYGCQSATATGTGSGSVTQTGTSSGSATGTATTTGTGSGSPTHTGTGSSTATGTSSSTAISQSVAPTVPPASNSYIFGVQVSSLAVRSLGKRQVDVGANGGFVGGAGPVNTSDCTLATPFTFENGQLSSGGQLISVAPGIDYQQFITEPTVQSTSTTFGIQDNVLVWYNQSFTGYYAQFCQDADGQVWTVFNEKQPPFVCNAVELIVYQTQQCASNGTIINGTTSSTTPPTRSATASTGSAPATKAATSTSSSSIPTAPPSYDSYIFNIAAVADNDTVVRKRQLQLGNGFVGAAGPVNPTDCALATPFTFTDGTLSSGGQLISTDPNVAYQPFWTNPNVSSITTTFAMQDGVLVWSNAAFTNLDAAFCQDSTGQVWVVFDAKPPPFQCTPVMLIPFAVSQCSGGSIVTSATTGTAAPTPCTSGSCLGNGTLTLAPGTFFNDAVPATARPIAQCVVRNESWVYGQTTLLPNTAV